MSLGTVGGLIGSLSMILYLILALVSLRGRRASREAKQLRQVREVNIAAMDWGYRVRTIAASHGFLHLLPPVPKEMTPDFLYGKAEGEGNMELEQVAKVVEKFAARGKDPRDE